MQNTTLCFRHPDLRGAEPALTGLGLPKAISGNFASVFSLALPGGGDRYAVKCFTRYVPDQNERYQAISKHLTSLPSARLSQPWNMGFDYLADEILVNGERYPILKMEWVQGQGLASWLDHHHRDSTQVRKLADRFTALIDDLHTHGIAHGDLQHGNLLVAPDLTLRLVDYDGMYVPALAGRHGTEDGHRNYQSPLRGGRDFGPDMDLFSGWVIHTALKAVAADPRLWADLHEPSGEYLLLSEDDYKAPAASPRFARLLNHPDPDVAQSAQQLADLVDTPISAIPRLRTRAQSSGTGPQPSGTGHASGTPGTGLPDWLREHVLVAESSDAAPSHPEGPGFRHRRRTRDLLALPVLLVSLAVPVLFALGVLSIGIIATAASATAGLVFFENTRRTRPELREVRQQLKALKERKWAAQNPAAAAAQLDKEIESFEDSERERAADADRESQRLTRQHQQRLAKIESDKQKLERDLRLQLTRLDDELTADIARRLALHQQRYLEGQLQNALIEDAKIPGIGQALKRALASAGIRTAADFHGVTIVSAGGRYSNLTAYIDRTGGGRIDVKGIGPTKARALEQWREQRVVAARFRSPTKLPADQLQAARAESRQRKTDLQGRLRDIASQAASATQNAEQNLQQARGRLRQEAERARATARARREAFARRSVQIRQASDEIPVLDAALAAGVQRRRQLSAFSYLRFLTTGRPGSGAAHDVP
ncbi:MULTISPECIES: protein kinase domain-containing protein [Streptomycetaceae]|uniref:Protein kinase domain-containing protein n=1 Tax=Streptantibioticus cattleyicolor (strain ATCC 35852 / DSM 46488 / JCM 4925 / NBRC 14057 / NRRL 8057) TaxID=1003195 RepID=F8JQ32_STREN|nr:MULTISPECIES: hypothetical protein [Streptomycetaceae]AEW95296.1 hypothetical protein SCATT_29250 [Streptantibioticus cattleyicolor NRRL 8057 = DSM 46488]MYS59877.1 hypothetical protein [Streptomyces sp. SID5468]CCB75639.1 conserved protein of unknown function [Streptantibioticus cattleyicolor NRRL 8057 = DSM 46488]